MQISEEEVVLEFLTAELHSSRFRFDLLSILNTYKLSEEIITYPNISSLKENQQRAFLLGELRGFLKNKKIFKGMPMDINWYTETFSYSQFQNLLCVNDEKTWKKFSGSNRLIIDASKTILNLNKNPASEILAIREKITNLHQPSARLIFITNSKSNKYVILEGHCRACAYSLCEASFFPLEVIVGRHDNIEEWIYF